jgi:hypothetical protein
MIKPRSLNLDEDLAILERWNIPVLEYCVELVQATLVFCLAEDNRSGTPGDLTGSHQWGDLELLVVSFSGVAVVLPRAVGVPASWVAVALGNRDRFTLMPRQLRSRRSRPNYASLHTGEEVEVYVPDPEEQESGSEFAANDSDLGGDADAPADGVEPDAEGSEDELDGEGGPSPKPTLQVKETKSKSRGPSTRPRKSVPVGPSRPSKSAPPTTHHRHRPPPLFRRDAQVERLIDPPALFRPSTIVLTNSFTSSPRTTKRLERSWSRNVGPGPVHELLEDRAWFKEAIPDVAAASEASRRPVIYETVKLDGKYQVIAERSVPCVSSSPY